MCAKHLWAEKFGKKLKKEKKEKKKKRKEKENDECECSNVAYDRAANRVLSVARQSVSVSFSCFPHYLQRDCGLRVCACFNSDQNISEEETTLLYVIFMFTHSLLE